MAITFFSINGAGSGGGGGTTVHTGNGISGDGSVATPVVLGGNPLTHNTTINQGAFKLSFLSSDASTNQEFLAEYTDPGANITSHVDVTPGITEIRSTDNASGDLCFFQTSTAGGVVEAEIVATTATGLKSLTLATGPGSLSGIQVDDSVDHIGLRGTDLFNITGDPDQYLQFGNVSFALLNAAAQDTAGQTTTQVIPPAYTPAVDSIIRINAYAFYRTGTGTVAVTVAYTDVLSNHQTALLGSIGVGTPVTAFPATILKVKGGTTVSVTYTVTGTITYDAGATIENLFT